MRSRAELLLVRRRRRPRRHDGRRAAVGPPAVGGAVAGAVGARGARPGADGRPVLLQLEDGLAPVSVGSLKWRNKFEKGVNSLKCMLLATQLDSQPRS